MADSNKTEVQKKFRKRPNKSEIEKQAKLRGLYTHNELVTLEGLKVKNALQRIYNKTMDDSLSKTKCDKLKKAMAEFNEVVKSVLE